MSVIATRAALAVGRMVFTKVGVFFVKRMPLNANGLRSMDSNKPYATQRVRPIVHDFNMHRIHASMNSAQVITFILKGQRAVYEHLVYQAMGTLLLAEHLNTRVPISVERSGPEPARDTFIRHARIYCDLLKQACDASQVRTILYYGINSGFTLASNSLAAFFTVVAKTAGITRSAVETRQRLNGLACTTAFGWNRIWKGHIASYTGNGLRAGNGVASLVFSPLF